MIPDAHRDFIDRAVEILKRDGRLAGAALGGSYISGNLDEFSDLDFVLAVYPEFVGELMGERLQIAERLGSLLSAFTGEHIGEPRLVICLYDSPLLHVDLKFVSLDDLDRRIEDPVILFERDNALTGAWARRSAVFPYPDLQWFEDRFWVWIHYVAGKIGRGELFEAMESISFLRQAVLGPLVLMKNGKLPRGVRKIEADAPDDLPALLQTVAAHDALSCCKALSAAAELYIGLRKPYLSGDLIVRQDAEKRSMAYLDDIAHGCRAIEGA